MKLIVTLAHIRLLVQTLKKAGRRETGGVLVAEHVGDDTFRLVGLSVQTTGGSTTHFVRDPAEHRAFLDAFFDRTGHDYARYNYFGEWGIPT
jgi:[CysO sulfur-carrier protein]-S-L-cysteine hydrolase